MLLAVCQHYDIDAPDDIIPGIAFGFGGGLGNTGSVCGAVAGAVMAIGLKRHRGGGTLDDALRELAVSGEFRRRFETAMGSISCRELTGMDLSTPEGLQLFMSSDVPARVCFPAVNTAYRVVTELLDDME